MEEEFERLTREFIEALSAVDASREDYETACRVAIGELQMELPTGG